MAAASALALAAAGGEKSRKTCLVVFLFLLILFLMPVFLLILIVSAFLAMNDDYYYPLEYTTAIYSDYGPRDPITVWVPGYGWMTTSNFHSGVDFSAPTGTPIYASCGGTVTTAANLGSYGNCVIITKENGDYTRYFHMDTIDVQAGEMVLSGQQIGTVGSTGISTGPHLHFEIWLNGEHVDPSLLLKERTESVLGTDDS